MEMTTRKKLGRNWSSGDDNIDKPMKRNTILKVADNFGVAQILYGGLR